MKRTLYHAALKVIKTSAFSLVGGGHVVHRCLRNKRAEGRKGSPLIMDSNYAQAFLQSIIIPFVNWRL